MPKKDTKQPSKVKDRIISITFIVVAFILFDLTPFGGTLRYYGEWIACGSQPLMVQGSGALNGDFPHYYKPSAFVVFPGARTYFCTAFDAEKHGYSAETHTYSFPVLKANNALCKKATDPEPETAAQFSPCE